MAKQFIVSIGREYGSGGRVIAEHLAEKLNVPFYDRNMTRSLVIFGFQGLLTVSAIPLRILSLKCSLTF